MYWQKVYNYPLNPNIVAAWAFMAAYGATLGAVRLLDWRIRVRGRAGGLAGKQESPKSVDI